MLGEDERRAVLAVLDSGQLAQGAVVDEFEGEFARLCDARHAVAVSSGTAGLHATLLAHGIGAGDEVITSPFTFVASANAALFVGARPVLVDIDPETFGLDPDGVEAAISPRARAILAVHLFGHPALMPELRAIADRHGLLLIEDACQAHGATIHGGRVGSLGNSGVFSLYPTKNMTAGEGGVVTTNDDHVAKQVRLLRNHGQSERYRHEILGYNFRLSDLHAAVGLAQLRKLEGFNAQRRRNASLLTKGLQGLEAVVTPCERPGYTHVFHQYTIRVTSGRGDLPSQLLARGIETAVHYPIPVHQQPLYQRIGYDEQRFPVAERLAAEVLSLPVHPMLSEDDVARIIAALWDVIPAR